MMTKVVVDIEVPDAGRKEHYPVNIDELPRFLEAKFKEFDGEYIETRSKKVNSINSYNDFDLESVLRRILSSKKIETIKIDEYPACLVSFSIRTKNMGEAKIYVSIK